MKLWVERYNETKFFALYDGNDLVCVTVYKKGANEVKRRLEELERRLEEITNTLYNLNHYLI
jgi:hypothetical protein